ncbi:pentapeptide repeat-containing protein [Vibrio bivalvicida]|uniref:Pentapeptide repeat-containing protein n=1 Tax=Vibrio bivalvicida TaxID=1276888 RepID=A0ABV4MFZ3_9VIBR
MTINDRNRFAFSYTAHDVRDKNFIYKNFNKAVSYHSNFSQSKFNATSLVGAKFKFCSFYGATFDNCLIRGALFRKCNFQQAVFKNCIISSSVFDRTTLKNCKFIDCKVVSTGKFCELTLDENLVNTKVYSNFPLESAFEPALIQAVEQLRNHNQIRKSTVLHRKKGKLDTVSIEVLQEEFGDEFLIKYLPVVAEQIKVEFHTLTYVQSALRKIGASAKV